jgi:hypothetical protein
LNQKLSNISSALHSPEPLPTIAQLPAAAATTPSATTATITGRDKIVFTAEIDLYMVNPDGTDLVPFADNLNLQPHVSPGAPLHFSPDGTRIAFVDQVTRGAFALYTMNSASQYPAHLVHTAAGQVRQYCTPMALPAAEKRY